MRSPIPLLPLSPPHSSDGRSGASSPSLGGGPASYLRADDQYEPHLCMAVIMMDPEGKKFGRGPRELTGAVDLISHYKLVVHHDFFCKRTLPLSISETHYLRNVVGEAEIRKGDGMELDQLFQNASYSRETTDHMRPFDLETLGQAFRLRETAPIDLPPAEKGLATISRAFQEESKDNENKCKRHKDKDRDKDKEHKKHKHRHKDRSKDKDRERKDKSGHPDSGGNSLKKHHHKASGHRRCTGD